MSFIALSAVADSLWQRWQRPIQVGLSLVGAAVLVYLLIHPEGRGIDARGYWNFDLTEPYRSAMGNLDADVALRYSPPVALTFVPARLLSFDAFLWCYTALLLVAAWWLARDWAFALFAFYPVGLELSYANVHLLLAAAIVLGLRRPAAWSLLLLTKVTPFVIVAWFVTRREWRALIEVVAASAVICLVSVFIAPDWWRQWLELLVNNAGLEPRGLTWLGPLAVRLPLALILTIWGARRDERWVLPLAATLALPTIWPAGLSLLVAEAGLLRRGQPESAPADVAAV